MNSRVRVEVDKINTQAIHLESSKCANYLTNEPTQFYDSTTQNDNGREGTERREELACMPRRRALNFVMADG